MRISMRIQKEAPDSGNSDPDSSHSGIRNRLMTAWNAGGRIHRPGDDEAQRGQRKRHQKDDQDGQRKAQPA